MKPVARLEASPPGLAAWRAAHPEDVPASGAEAGRAWSRFRDDPAYREVLGLLAGVQGGLCAYCEQRITDAQGSLVPLDYQIEHVVPKEGDPAGRLSDRVINAQNFILCCAGGVNPALKRDETRYHPGLRKLSNESCGQRKGNRLLSLDPRDIPQTTRIVWVATDGQISPDPVGCASAGIPVEAVRQTLDLLNLNCQRLRYARESILEELEDHIDRIRESLRQIGIREETERALWEQISWDLLAPDVVGHLRAFWTVYQDFLRFR